MFKNLHTGTKLFVLCGLFIGSLGVASYGLFNEKQIAIDVARQELLGSRYLSAIRDAYVAVLLDPQSTGPPQKPRAQVLGALSSAEAAAAKTMQTAELKSAFADVLTRLWSVGEPRTPEGVVDVLSKARSLAARVGSESHLTFDPEPDTYYLQSIVVDKIPLLIGQVSELQLLFDRASAAGPPRRNGAPAPRSSKAFCARPSTRFRRTWPPPTGRTPMAACGRRWTRPSPPCCPHRPLISISSGPAHPLATPELRKSPRSICHAPVPSGLPSTHGRPDRRSSTVFCGSG